MYEKINKEYIRPANFKIENGTVIIDFNNIDLNSYHHVLIREDKNNISISMYRYAEITDDYGYLHLIKDIVTNNYIIINKI